MKQFWYSLQPREQRFLIGGGAALGVLLFYVLLIDPLVVGVDRLQASVEQQRGVVSWMESASSEIKALRGSSPERKTAGGKSSLMSLVDATARKHELGSALKQINPTGNNVRVQFEGAPFDRVLLWLGELSSKHGVAVDTLTMERLSDAGMVDASVILGTGE